MQCRSCTPWLASVLCFTNSKTSTASHCILLLPSGRMEIAEKPASRRKKAGFTFSERFGATIGQHPVITFACQANSTHPLIHSTHAVPYSFYPSQAPARWIWQNRQWSLFLFRRQKHRHKFHAFHLFGSHGMDAKRKLEWATWRKVSFVLTGLRIHRWDKWSSYSSTAPDHCKQRQPRSRLHDSNLDCLRVLTAKSWIGVWQDRRIQLFNPFHPPCPM